jgi:outer membrane protein assembly factor BamB
VIYVGSRDGCVHALSAATGASVRNYCASDSITGKPVIDGNAIYYPSFDGRVYAARLSDGAAMWNYDTKGALPHDLAEAGNLILAGSRSYDLVAIDKTSGRPAWTRYIWWSWVDSFPDIRDRDILMGSSDAQRIYDLDARTGRPRWATFVGGWAWPKPARGRSLVYAGLVGTTMPYVGKRVGGLAAFDARTGRLQWVYRTPHGDKDIRWGFAAAPLVVGNRVYAADLQGRVFAFEAR